MLNCFFGYKLQKFFITVTGVIIGLLLGALFGVLIGAASGAGEATVIIAVLMAVAIAVLGGFLAFKLWWVFSLISGSWAPSLSGFSSSPPAAASSSPWR